MPNTVIYCGNITLQPLVLEIYNIFVIYIYRSQRIVPSPVMGSGHCHPLPGTTGQILNLFSKFLPQNIQFSSTSSVLSYSVCQISLSLSLTICLSPYISLSLSLYIYIYLTPYIYRAYTFQLCKERQTATRCGWKPFYSQALAEHNLKYLGESCEPRQETARWSGHRRIRWVTARLS